MAQRTAVSLQPDARLSAIHAAFVVASGDRCVDSRTEAILVPKATALNTRLVSASIDIGQFWNHYLVETLRGQAAGKACEDALLAAGGNELQLDQTSKAVARLLSDCVAVFEKRYPKLTDQLPLRGKPLSDRWGTVGPGLLLMIAKQIWGSEPPSDWWPPKVQGVLLQPMRGGDGGHDAESKRFWIEAMLTDSDPLVPEVLRMAWLVTQIAIGRHLMRAGQDGEQSLPWALGTIPVVLQAGAELELTRAPLPIAEASQSWRMGGAEVSAVLGNWWQQFQENEAPMPVALKALDKMLQPIRQRLSSSPVDMADSDELI